MTKFITYSLLIFIMLLSQVMEAQNVVGKKFEAKLGGINACGYPYWYSKVTICKLDLKKDSVIVTFRSITNGSEYEKQVEKIDKITTHHWKQKGNKIYIKNFPDGHKEYIIKEDKLLVWYRGIEKEYLLIK